MKTIDINSIARHWAIDPEAMQNVCVNLKDAQAGFSLFHAKQLAENRNISVNNGIAIIPVHGIITPRMDFFTFLMGGTALENLAQDIKDALKNEAIRGILLDFDSPGGVAVGPAEMAEIIQKANIQKPVWAYVGRNCCSAAYWLACATSRIVTHKTALLGSIGVVSTVPVQEQSDADGYRQIDIVSSNARHKRPDPRTPDGEKTIRAELDALENEFISSVAMYRNVSVESVRTDFGQGGVLIGANAVKVGMSDDLSDFDSTLNSFSNFLTQKQGVNTMGKENAGITPEQIDAYRAEGAKVERERLLALDDVAIAGHEELLAKAKSDPNMTAEKLALEIVKAEKVRGNGYVASLKSAEAAMPQIIPSVVQSTATVGATPQERAENEWNAKADIRQEFDGDKAAFIAYFVAQESGQIKIQNRED